MAGPGRGGVRGRALTVDPGALHPVLDEAEHVYVAVRTRRGPHVTPELFTVSGDRIICMTAASTLKAELAAKAPIMGVAARSAAGTLAVVCEAEVLDLVDPTTWMSSPGTAMSSPLDVARFVRDNAAELAGATADALRGRLGVPPHRRVVLALRPIAVAAEVDGEARSGGWGSVPAADEEQASSSPDEELDADALPADLQGFLGEGDAVLGWTRADGTPLALPVHWDGTAATVATALFDATGAASTSAMSVTFDAWTGFGPTGKQGLMLRGRGEARRSGASVQVAVEVERATYWDGVETGTIDAGSTDADSTDAGDPA